MSDANEVTALRDRIADALHEAPDQLVVESAFGGIALREAQQRATQRADKVMPIVNELAADLGHAERDNRRLQTENEKLRRQHPPELGNITQDHKE